MIWFIYRKIFVFPVWFDETVGKAVFFGLPVWLYVSLSGFSAIPNSFALYKLKTGLLQGVAVGGILGFAASIIHIAQGGLAVRSAQLFMSDLFWWEFFLSLMTGFWETLFFYSWIMVIIQDKFRHWLLSKQLILVSAIFIIFHIPNTFLRFSGADIYATLVLLSIFAIGQGLLFSRNQNAYALVISHAIWGMVLAVQF